MYDAEYEWLAEELSCPIGTVLCLGAGLDLAAGRFYGNLLNSPAQEIWVVDPLEVRQAVLRQELAGDSRVTLVARAVSEHGGKQPYYCYNSPGLSGLRPATELAEIFPGLRLSDSGQIDSISVADLLETLPPRAAQSDCLVVDTPGSELALLQQFDRLGQLQRFGDIFLRAGRRPFYEGAGSLAEILRFLEERGYRVRQRSDVDPDFPELYVRLDPLVVENQKLRIELDTTVAAQASRLAELEQAHKVAEIAKAQALAACDKAQERGAALERRLAERDKQLERCVLDLRRAEGQLEVIASLLREDLQ